MKHYTEDINGYPENETEGVIAAFSGPREFYVALDCAPGHTFQLNKAEAQLLADELFAAGYWPEKLNPVRSVFERLNHP